MKRNSILSLAVSALLATGLLAAGGCKSSGMAVTEKGQLFKINIQAPSDLTESGEGNIDVVLGNRGVNNIQDVLIDVELPPQVVVLDETHDRGINIAHDPGSSTYHYTISKIQPAEDSHLRYKVRASFGTMRETGDINVTAWQKDLPNDKLFRKTIIKLRG